jgi:sulfatase modifying factor 1
MKILCRAWLCSALGTLASGGNPELQIDLGGGVSLPMVEAPAGSYMRGSPETETGRGADETPHAVTLSRPFLIGKSPVTVAHWERFVAETGYRTEAEKGTSGGFGWNGSAMVQSKTYTWRNPGFPQTADHPVCIVTFADSQAFCSWIERKSKRHTNLPTEAQWEYACRAGTTSAWHTEAAAWHKGNAGNSTHPVFEKPANPWGITIGGNVSEWCLDWYAPYPPGPLTDPLQENRNLSDKPRRVQRGGSWNRDAKNTRSASRWRSDPGSRTADNGFRIVCSTEVIAPPPPPAPKVEAEPGVSIPSRPSAPQSQMPPPAPQPSSPPLGSPVAKGVGGLLSGLLCLLVPVGLLVLLVRMISSHGKPAANPFVAPAMPETETEPEAPLPMQVPIRKTGDGFWIQGRWDPGSHLRLRYVVAGSLHEMDLIYQPGPDGQFVFTGTEPDSVSIVSDDGVEMVPPPLMPDPTPLFRDRDDEPARSSRPPRFPSAY